MHPFIDEGFCKRLIQISDSTAQWVGRTNDDYFQGIRIIGSTQRLQVFSTRYEFLSLELREISSPRNPARNI